MRQQLHSGCTASLNLERFAGDRRFAQSLARGLSVLRAFRAGDGPLGNQELAQRTGLSKATVSRLTFTLSQLGYLQHLPAMEKYRLGSGVLALGNSANSNLPFLASAAVVMQALANQLEALVAIAVPNGTDMLMTHGWRPVHASSVWLPIGTQFPMTRSGVGLAYLSSVPTRELHHLVDKVLTRDASTRAGLYSEVHTAKAQLRATGFIPSFGLWVPSIFAVAVPFRSALLGEPYVFFCGAPSESNDRQRVCEILGPSLADQVSRLGADLQL